MRRAYPAATHDWHLPSRRREAIPAQEKPWTKTQWVYDLRTNMHFTQKTNPLQRADLDEFVECYRPAKRHLRKPTWREVVPEGRWRSFDFDDLMKRDKVNLVIILAP